MLLDRYGKPIVNPTFQDHKKAKSFATAPLQPKMGDQFGAWSGRQSAMYSLPGGAMLSFDLSTLDLPDFRSMRDHYQINASLSVLSFVLHQIDWKIECEDEEIRTMIEQNIRDIWTQLMRALSQAFWAGYAPNVLNFENDPKTGYVVVDKVKDLVPEECRVNWKKVYGYAPRGTTPPTFYQYDGIIQAVRGRSFDGSLVGNSTQAVTAPIPSENSLWYPFQMENGDYYGKKMLRPAFPAWYFSQIIHLFANRYFERFGEPTAIGRADFDAQMEDAAGVTISGKQAMERIVTSLRSRSVVVLPSDRDPVTKEYDFDLDYLESQMRGADFERYLDRLDEEMSLAVFTPVLLFRTSNVGSYNLGQSHMKVFLWMLNSIAGDIKQYLQKYLIDRLRIINFGENSPKAVWSYRKLGKDDTQVLSQMLQALVSNGFVMPDLEELGVAIGLNLREIEILSGVDADGNPVKPNAPSVKPDPNQDSEPSIQATHPSSLDRARAVVAKAVDRAHRTALNGKPVKDVGFRNSLAAAFAESGADTVTATRMANYVISQANNVADDLSELEPDTFRDALGQHMDRLLDEAC